MDPEFIAAKKESLKMSDHQRRTRQQQKSVVDQKLEALGLREVRSVIVPY
jgi:hypothetical protein